MLLGIDVGGTFTDAVLLRNEQILSQSKMPTNTADILQSILAALDVVLPAKKEQVAEIERVVISSTVVTNAIAEGKVAPVFLAVVTGPGMNVDDKFPVSPVYLEGCVDHRGKVTAPLNLEKLRERSARENISCSAVSCKFSVREPSQEQMLAEQLRKFGSHKVFLGSEMSGELNFIRRTNSAYYAAAVSNLFDVFCDRVSTALAVRNIKASVHILKADGGTVPLSAAAAHPVEAVFTGPAASVLGIEALTIPYGDGISLDVGGTTTDIAFWQNGNPLMAKRGAVINSFPTAVRSFHMRSLGIGGDSRIRKTASGYTVGPEREGKAAALGGLEATLSDALIAAGYVEFGDAGKSYAALLRFGSDVSKEARAIIDAAVSKLQLVIEEMLAEWERQPVYKVEDVLRGTTFHPEVLIGVGGGAPGLVRALGEKMNVPVEIPLGGMVANAVGAAVARPTLAAGLHADTTEGTYIIPESGQRCKLPPNFSLQTGRHILERWLQERASAWQLSDLETELTSCEHFKTIHGYYDSGDIYNLRMQLKPGILYKVKGKEVKF